MQVTLHVYPTNSGKIDDTDRFNLFVSIDGVTKPWDKVKGFNLPYRIAILQDAILESHGVFAVVRKHTDPFYTHLPAQGLCLCR